MSLSSLVTATESAVRMSESAVAAAEEAMAAARLASIHANSALAAARLALELESSLRRERDFSAQAHSHSPLENNPSQKRPTEERQTRRDSETTSTSTALSLENNSGQLNHQGAAASLDIDRRFSPALSEESEAVEQLRNLELESEGTEEHEEREAGSKKKKNCRNCKMYKRQCLNEKFVLRVIKKTVGMKVVGWSGPPDMVGRVGTVVGGGEGEISVSWNSKQNEKVSSYSLKHQGEHAFKFFCLESEPTPTFDEESLDSEVSEYDRKLFVGGLDRSVTDQYLKEYFETYGTLTDWVVMKTQTTKLSRGSFLLKFVVFL